MNGCAWSSGFGRLYDFPADIITMTARFLMDGEVHGNTFKLEHAASRVTMYRTGGGAWHSMEGFAPGCYPISACPLLLPEVEEHFHGKNNR